MAGKLAGHEYLTLMPGSQGLALSLKPAKVQWCEIATAPSQLRTSHNSLQGPPHTSVPIHSLELRLCDGL